MCDGYNSAHVRRITGLRQRQLDYWDECGIVSPSVRAANGKGSERRYSFSDIVKLRVVKELRGVGVSLQKIREATARLRKQSLDGDPLLDHVLSGDGKTIFWMTKSGQLADALNSNQLVLSIVQVGLIRDDIRESVLRFEPQETKDTAQPRRKRATS